MAICAMLLASKNAKQSSCSESSILIELSQKWSDTATNPVGISAITSGMSFFRFFFIGNPFKGYGVVSGSGSFRMASASAFASSIETPVAVRLETKGIKVPFSFNRCLRFLLSSGLISLSRCCTISFISSTPVLGCV
jgi:hypothetical protein